MICEPCGSGQHTECEDELRMQGWLAFQSRPEFAGTKDVAASMPTQGCDCQHKGNAVQRSK